MYYFFSQGINRTLLSWIKLWDETVFGHSSLSSNTGKEGSKMKEKGGEGSKTGPALRGSDGVRGGGTSGRGGLHGGKSEWREIRDPVTFSSEEVGVELYL